MTGPLEGPSVATEVRLGPLRLPNPVLTASGTFGYGREAARFIDLNRLGGITVKGVSLEPWPGNPGPRIVETPGGMLNAIGLQNPGVEHFLQRDLPWLRRFRLPILVNVIGRTAEEYAAVAQRLEAAGGVAALELNISCPNIKAGGIQFGTDPLQAGRLTEQVRRSVRLPLIVKLSPNAPLVPIARAVREAGADILSLVNTLPGMVIDVRRRRPVLANGTGGLSGPALRPLAVRLVWELYAAGLGLPIIGMGGIESGRDALQFMLAGADAVSVGTASFRRPDAALQVLEEMIAVSRREGVARLADWTGAAHESPPERASGSSRGAGGTMDGDGEADGSEAGGTDRGTGGQGGGMR